MNILKKTETRARVSRRVGLRPENLIHISEPKAKKVKVTVFSYDPDRIEEKTVKHDRELQDLKQKGRRVWVNIDGAADPSVIEGIGRVYGLHPLLIEDITAPNQRPKLEDYGDYLFIVLRMLYYGEDKNEILSEQVSIILGPDYVLSFQEGRGDVFDEIRERLRNGKGRLRHEGADYLAYALLDAVVDSYFQILEKFGEQIDKVEDVLMRDAEPSVPRAINNLKREVIFLRKLIWPLREVVGALERQESPLIRKATAVYLRDVYDHTVQTIDAIETYRDILSGMLDLYLSTVSNRMNEVMKILTMFASIFIPLTFIAGVYGMNFRHMPELEWPRGYFFALALMAGVAGGLILYFKRKRWL